MRKLRTILSLGLAAACLGLPGTFAAEAPLTKEYQLKAAYLYSFTKFVEWPASSFLRPDDPIIIGIVRPNPFGTELSKAVEGRKINGRSVVIRSVETAAEAQQVHVLFASSAVPDEQLAAILPALRDKPVLTVGENAAFSKRGGVATFKLDQDKVRFDLNMDTAEAGRLRISAQLQKLAQNVHKTRRK